MRTAVVVGLKTLFYDGKKLWKMGHFVEQYFTWERLKNTELTEEEKMKHLSRKCRKYFKKRWSWRQVIIEEGVTVIPHKAFIGCKNIERVIFADTVTLIKDCAFQSCEKLACIKLSVNLECIRKWAFADCNLSSVFVPQSFREIQRYAFASNENLSILQVSQGTELDDDCIDDTKLAEFVPSETDPSTRVKNINEDDTYALHRACSSYQPLREVIYGIIDEKGLKAFNEKNEIGVSPSRYLKENPYADLTEMDIVKDYMSKKLNFLDAPW